MRTQIPEECECIGVFEVTVNFVQQRFIRDAPQLFCVETCLLSPLKTNSAFRTSRFLVCAVFFFLMAQRPPLWARASSFARFLDYTQRRTAVGRTHLDEWSARRRDLYLTTQNDKTTFIHGPGGVRTHNLSERASADLCLKPRGHRDRLYLLLGLIKMRLRIA
jgi:hypothetical protein